MTASLQFARLVCRNGRSSRNWYVNGLRGGPQRLAAQAGREPMTFGKRLLVSSTSLAALIVAAPALAATDTDTATSTSEVVVTGIKESLQRAIQIKRVNT